MEIKIKKLFSEAKLPTYAHQGDAGMDFYSNQDVTIAAGEYSPVDTGIAIEIPDGYVGLIWDKSGIANKGIKTTGGVVDSGYRGEIKIQLRNLSEKEYNIEKGDKIAQMLIQKVESPKLIEVSELTDSERGDSRFGSTGIK